MRNESATDVVENQPGGLGPRWAAKRREHDHGVGHATEWIDQERFIWYSRAAKRAVFEDRQRRRLVVRTGEDNFAGGDSRFVGLQRGRGALRIRGSLSHGKSRHQGREDQSA